jgi:ABC-type transporter Mla MlaB component
MSLADDFTLETMPTRAFASDSTNDPSMPPAPIAPLRLSVEPPIGARRFTIVRVQGEASTEPAIERLLATCEALIAKPVFAIHLDFSGATASDSKLLSALVLLIRKARESRVGVTIGLPEPIATMAIVYRVSELLRPHLIPLGS